MRKDHRESINNIVKAMKELEKLEGKFTDPHDKSKKVEKEDDDDDDFEEGMVKVTKSEKIVQEGNKKVKIIIVTKTMEDGSIVKEKKKEFL